MKQPTTLEANPTGTEAGIEKGLGFLAEHQLHHGEFCTYMGASEDLKEWAVPDSITFSTAVIGTLLLPRKDDPMVRPMLDKAGSFLKYQIMRNGTWSYYTKWSGYFPMVPADTDDTACISFFLREMGVGFPDNRRMLLDNRNRKGLFYTWFTFRFQRSSHLEYWKLVLREFKRPYKMLLLRRKLEASKNDADAVVDANVLYYLGSSPDTDPVIGYLLKVIAENREDNCDKWYCNPFILYYAITRNYFHGIRKLVPAIATIVQLVLQQVHADGSIGGLFLDTGLGPSSLLHAGYEGPEISAAVRYLLSRQSPNGSRPRQVIFWIGPSKKLGLGSEEISTAVCIGSVRKIPAAENRKRSGNISS